MGAVLVRVEPGDVVGGPLSLGQGGFVLIVEADDFAFLRGGEPVGEDGLVFLRGGVQEVICVVACHLFNVSECRACSSAESLSESASGAGFGPPVLLVSDAVAEWCGQRRGLREGGRLVVH